MNQVRARTSTCNPVIRLLLVGLAFVLFNLYIALRQNLDSALKKPLESSRRFGLSMRRVTFLLSRAIERFWGTTEIIQHQSCFVLSCSTDNAILLNQYQFLSSLWVSILPPEMTLVRELIQWLVCSKGIAEL